MIHTNYDQWYQYLLYRKQVTWRWADNLEALIDIPPLQVDTPQPQTGIPYLMYLLRASMFFLRRVGMAIQGALENLHLVVNP